MKKFRRTVCMILTLCLLLSVAVIPAGAAGGTYSGTTGDCTWTLDMSEFKMTIKGIGAMADYYDSSFTPWTKYKEYIHQLEVEEGVTRIGESAFRNTSGLNYAVLPESLESIGANAFSNSKLSLVTIPENVTEIGVRAFENCEQLTQINLPEGLKKIGIMAFGGTSLTGIVIPSRDVEIGAYAFGYRSDGSRTELQSVTGCQKSTAQRYADSIGVRFIDIESPQYVMRIPMGRALNLSTGYSTEKAREGDRIRIYPRPEPNVTITGFTSEDAEIENIDGAWYFTMPAKSVTVYPECKFDTPLDIDFSCSSVVPLAAKEYVFLAFSSGLYAYCTEQDSDKGVCTYDLDQNGTDDVRISRYQAEKLPTASIARSIAFTKTGADYSPVTFLFAENVIRSARLYLTLPAAGDSYDYNTDKAEVYPESEAQYTVKEAHWFNEWGIAPDRFEGGGKYFAEITLHPNDGCAFTAGCKVLVNGAPAVDGTSAINYELKNDGDLLIYTRSFYIPGEAHAIHIHNGRAFEYEGEALSFRAIHEAKAGDKVWVGISTDDLSDDEFAVQGTVRYSSNEVTFEGEAQQYFIMPDEDVTIDVTCETRKQYNCVMDLRNGEVYHAVPDGGSPTSQDYGIYVALLDLSKNKEYGYSAEYNKNWYRFDLDGDGGYDIAKIENEYFLLDTSSLSSPTGQLTLSFERGDCIYFPVRSLTVIFADPTVQKHKINVSGGVAVAGSEQVTEAYAGESVYLVPDMNDLAYDEYVVQRSFIAVTDDAEICDEGDTFFVMPDKDVAVKVTYEKAKLLTGVMDLRSGTYTAAQSPDGIGAKSERYGMYFILSELVQRQKSEFNEQTNRFYFEYDIDNYGGYDIGYDDASGTFTLLEGNSLRPASGRITLALPQSEYYTVPMERLTILLAGDEQTPHKITVNGGLASAEKGSYDFVIGEQYMGEPVYILNDPDAVPAGKYIVKTTITSPDAELDGDCFIMPDRDVTINVSYELGTRSRRVLDFSENAVQTFSDRAVFDGIGETLAAGAEITEEKYDEELRTDVRYFDIDGDGAWDVRQCFRDMSFRKSDRALQGEVSIALDPEQRCVSSCYPLTVVYSGGALILGDTDGDGAVTVNDATMIQKHLAELIKFTPAQLKAADTNCDGVVNIDDATNIQKFLAEIIEHLG